MTKEEYISLASKEYDKIVSLQKHDNFYDYEKGFVGIWKELGKQVLEKSIGTPPSDRRKKKTSQPWAR